MDGEVEGGSRGCEEEEGQGEVEGQRQVEGQGQGQGTSAQELRGRVSKGGVGRKRRRKTCKATANSEH